jgi:predicted dehydrogenase
MKQLPRREFLAKSTLALGGTALSGSLSTSLWANSHGSNGDISIGIVGVGWKGGDHCKDFFAAKGARVRAICDVDQLHLDEEVERFKQRGQAVKTYRDVRDLLDDADIDAVVIATPNHWHALMTIWALQAGKDVYVEKPVSHDIWEGRRMLEAGDKYGRIVQAGTQARSNKSYDEAIEYLRAGTLGAVKWVHGIDYKKRISMGRVAGPQPIPPSVDYNLFQGPAPLEPLMRQKLHYDWHWQWPTGNGDMGNIGAHVVDNLRRIMGDHRQPRRVMSIGGRFLHQDDGETPNEHLAYLDYGDYPVFAEIRNHPHKSGADYMDNIRGTRNGVIVHCESGYLVFGFGGVSAYTNAGKRITSFSGESVKAHIDNFIDAVRNRDSTQLNCPLKIGVQGAELCHLANLSYRSGFPASFDSIKERMGEGPAVEAVVDGIRGNLERNGVGVENNPLTLGSWVSVNSEGDRLNVEDSRSELVAQALFEPRDYREPFVIG